jgi:hypothetical protein
MTPKLLDLRHLQSATGPKGASKVSKGALVMRNPAAVDCLGAHQMAVMLGTAPYQVKAAGGDRDLARHRRALNVHAHVSAFTDGTFVAAYPLLAYVFHGNGMNPHSIGVETEGLYNGAPGGKGAEPSDLTIETTRAACTWIVEQAAREGATIRFVEAHRQHAKSRRGDPGWRLWQAVYVDHCEGRLGLKPRPDATTRDGLRIPKIWDPRCSAAY